MIHERLQDLEIKITELANYLQVSRPTMYKFIEAYDKGERDVINKNVLKLFDYISENKLIDKRNVIAFILTNLTNLKTSITPEQQKLVNEIEYYVSMNPKSEKTEFIRTCIQKSSFDVIIHYLIDISPLLSKKRLSAEQKKLLKPYKEIIGFYTK